MRSALVKIRGWWLGLGLGLVVFLAACGGGGDEERPLGLVLQAASVTLQPGGNAVVAVTQGFPPYRVVSRDSTAVQALMQGRSEVWVNARPEAPAGTYQVSVSDARGASANLSVSVQVAPLRVLASTPLYLSPSGDPAVVAVMGGVPSYRVAVDQPSVVRASIAGGQLTLQALNNLGQAKVTVTDAQGNRADLDVQVRTARPLVLQPSQMTVLLGAAPVELQIQGGFAPYSAVVSQPGAVSVSVAGSVVRITGLAQTLDAATVTVTDQVGQTAQSDITVQPAVREFGMTPNRVVVSEASDQEIPFVFLGQTSTEVPIVFSSNVRLLQPVSSSITRVSFRVQGTSACVEEDEEVTVTAVAGDGAIATATVVVKNIANQYDDEGKLISRCPPPSL